MRETAAKGGESTGGSYRGPKNVDPKGSYNPGNFANW